MHQKERTPCFLVKNTNTVFIAMHILQLLLLYVVCKMSAGKVTDRFAE